MAQIRKWLTAIVCLVFPGRLKPVVLNALGHKISRTSRIGFSVLLVERMMMQGEATIGHFNIVRCRRLALKRKAAILKMNFIKGNRLSLYLKENAVIGNRNVITCDGHFPWFRASLLRLGVYTKITADHRIDASEGVFIGDYSILAGAGSQIWTHGYIHHSSGLGRAEVRQKIKIGSNVYIGSMCCFSPGVAIGNQVSVGAHSSISRDLLEPGLYVSQTLRHIRKSPEERIEALEQVSFDQRRPFFSKKNK